MAFTIKPRTISNVTVLDMSGRLCFMEYALREMVNAFLREGQRNFVFNLAEVPYIDSFGLGQLVTVWTSIKMKGGRVTLVQPGKRVRDLLKITKLEIVFPIFDDEATAIEDAGFETPKNR